MINQVEIKLSDADVLQALTNYVNDHFTLAHQVRGLAWYGFKNTYELNSDCTMLKVEPASMSEIAETNLEFPAPYAPPNTLESNVAPKLRVTKIDMLP